MMRAYGQTGQDAFLRFLLLRHGLIPRDPSYSGFYVDVGCAQPVTGSNTYQFYELGWKGICIDANPNSREAFVNARPNDIYVMSGVGEVQSEMTFYLFKNPQHNTFDGLRAQRASDRLVGTVDVPVKSLGQILAASMPDATDIDFLSMDIENFEIPAIRGMDWDTYQPKIVVIESIIPISKAPNSDITVEMKRCGYELVAHTGHDSFYLRHSK